jgi:hypothetical protein
VSLYIYIYIYIYIYKTCMEQLYCPISLCAIGMAARLDHVYPMKEIRLPR